MELIDPPASFFDKDVVPPDFAYVTFLKGRASPLGEKVENEYEKEKQNEESPNAFAKDDHLPTSVGLPVQNEIEPRKIKIEDVVDASCFYNTESTQECERVLKFECDYNNSASGNYHFPPNQTDLATWNSANPFGFNYSYNDATRHFENFRNTYRNGQTVDYLTNTMENVHNVFQWQSSNTVPICDEFSWNQPNEEEKEDVSNLGNWPHKTPEKLSAPEANPGTQKPKRAYKRRNKDANKEQTCGTGAADNSFQTNDLMIQLISNQTIQRMSNSHNAEHVSTLRNELLELLRELKYLRDWLSFNYFEVTELGMSCSTDEIQDSAKRILDELEIRIPMIDHEMSPDKFKHLMKTIGFLITQARQKNLFFLVIKRIVYDCPSRFPLLPAVMQAIPFENEIGSTIHHLHLPAEKASNEYILSLPWYEPIPDRPQAPSFKMFSSFSSLYKLRELAEMSTSSQTEPKLEDSKPDAIQQLLSDAEKARKSGSVNGEPIVLREVGHIDGPRPDMSQLVAQHLSALKHLQMDDFRGHHPSFSLEYAQSKQSKSPSSVVPRTSPESEAEGE